MPVAAAVTVETSRRGEVAETERATRVAMPETVSTVTLPREQALAAPPSRMVPIEERASTIIDKSPLFVAQPAMVTRAATAESVPVVEPVTLAGKPPVNMGTWAPAVPEPEYEPLAEPAAPVVAEPAPRRAPSMGGRLRGGRQTFVCGKCRDEVAVMVVQGKPGEEDWCERCRTPDAAPELVFDTIRAAEKSTLPATRTLQPKKALNLTRSAK
jgi:hypothetical protein